jgi:glycosyltransferase involved in cell wall biosynthesis
LIHAFEIIAAENKEILLVIVGTKMWRSSTLKIPSSLEDRIIFTGHLPLEQLADIMGSALALTYVPYFEGFGIPLVEAMKCGAPILAANTTSLPEVAGNAAIYCNPFDTVEIAEGMKQLIADKALREALSKNGLSRSELFSWDASAEKVWLILENTISGK